MDFVICSSPTAHPRWGGLLHHDIDVGTDQLGLPVRSARPAASSRDVPCTRAIMYAAYQSDQWWVGTFGPYSPWRISASRRSSVSETTSRLVPRPGRRVVTSCSSQPLPSGSVK